MPTFKDIVIKDPMHLDEHELTSKLEFWFDAKHREIFFCEVIKPFKMIGQRWATKDQPALPYVTGVVERDVQAGEAVWVRFDERKPETVEVETDSGMYVVNTREFDARIRPKLKDLA